MRGGARTESRAGRGEWCWRLAGLVLGAVVLGIGCNPLKMCYFIFEPDPIAPPKCPIACSGKDVKLVILTAHAGPLPTSPQLMRADWDLSWRLTQLLEERYRENKDRVTIVSPTQLKNYQNSHPGWRSLPPQEIGKHFKADYVLNLEINTIRLADRLNEKFLYQGFADITVTVTDVHKPVGEGEVFSFPYAVEYPKSTPLEVTEMGRQQFQAKLIDRIARDLVLFFAAHPSREKYNSD
jgi:hypothetical protein